MEPLHCVHCGCFFTPESDVRFIGERRDAIRLVKAHGIKGKYASTNSTNPHKIMMLVAGGGFEPPTFGL